MSPETLASYLKAGRVIAEVRKQVKDIVREEMPIIDICEKVESLIEGKGCLPAFPCNVGIDRVAAHYTSPPGDKSLIGENSIVKIDLGAHFDGYIADTAVTVNFNPEYEDMVSVVERALDEALKIAKPGAPISKISSVIEKEIKGRGYKPISNLTGHTIGRYQIHKQPSIPNVSSHHQYGKLKPNNAYAIEPFATTTEGAGEVVSGNESYIYHLAKMKPIKHLMAKKLFEVIKKRYWTTPFARRWLTGTLPLEQLDDAFDVLLSTRRVRSYPVLVEKTGQPVVQAEHTIVVTEKEAINITGEVEL